MLEKAFVKSAAHTILNNKDHSSGYGEYAAALYLADLLFAEHVDLAGKPYIGHLHRVANDVEDKLKPAALLHDLVEDIADWTYDDLYDIGFSDITVNCIRALTKPSDKGPFFNAIMQVGLVFDAIAVKRADLRDNANLLRWDHKPGPSEIRRVMKYFYADKYLAAIADEHIKPGTPFDLWMTSLPTEMQDMEMLRQEYKAE